MQPVIHYDYRLLRHTPAELRAEFAKLEWTRSQRLRTLAPDPGRGRATRAGQDADLPGDRAGGGRDA